MSDWAIGPPRPPTPEFQFRKVGGLEFLAYVVCQYLEGICGTRHAVDQGHKRLEPGDKFNRILFGYLAGVMTKIPRKWSNCSFGKELLEDDGAACKVRSQGDPKGDLQEGGHVKDLHKAVQQLRNVPEKELGLIAHVVRD